MKYNCLDSKRELLDVAKIIPHSANRNKHSDNQVRALAKVIAKNGQTSPIVIAINDGAVAKGHGRLDAIKLLGWDKAVVEWQQYEDDLHLFNDRIADNTISKYAEFQMDGFLGDIQELNLDPLEMDLEEFGILDFNYDPLEVKDSVDDSEEKKILNICPKCGFEF